MSLLPLILGVALGGQAVRAPQLDVTMYRSWMPPNVTVVHGLFRVDGEMLGTGPECAYRVQLAVIDASGTRLVNNEWDGRCPKPEGVAAGALETFQFAVLPAQYTVQVMVQAADAPERRLSANLALESLPVESAASDLILARRVGWVDSANTAQWTIRRGQLGLAAASQVVADEGEPHVAYYLEVYPTAERPMTGRLVGVIRRPDGKQLARLDLQKLESVVESRPLAGNVSLAGLAPGDYLLETRLELGDTVVIRSHAFHMAGLLATPQPAATGYFWSLTDEELAALFDPVVVTLQRLADRELYQRLNADGKRRFLQQYFGGVEPTAGGAGTNPLDVYLKRVRMVNAEFGERRGGLEGWRTDRGRIYMVRGEPASKVARPLPPAGAAPYEIWLFTIPSRYAYLFVDEARIDSYRLVFTNDPAEQSLPDWDRRVGADAIEELVRLGVPVPRTARPIRGP
jgi:GWxTD domain-containing protein